ncbi:MAG: hypothetical protein ACYS74_06455, partial [Planctomycetota bacterium]
YEAQVLPLLKPQSIRRWFSPKEHLCRLRDTKTLSVFNALGERERVTCKGDRSRQLHNLPVP